jgi:carboxypeptidase family protein
MTLRALVVMAVLLSAGCAARHGRPIIGGSTTPERSGTISGSVRNAMGTALSGRRVSAIDMATEAHYDATTGVSGGYTIKVPSGKYRLEVELRGGDVIATQPPQVDVNIGDVDAQLDFVIGR